MLPPWPPLPLDLLVTAGGTPVPCNRATLCQGSAYCSGQLSDSLLLTLDLPSVPADMFARLLACLYTGTLEVTRESVYPLFWYAQLLQMPSVVLQCSQFLASLATQASPPPPAPSSPPPAPKVVKPIPSRGVPLLQELQPNLLRPHLASFYSDWFLRYTSLTRQARQQQEAGGSSQEGEQELTQPSTSAMFATTDSLLDTASCDGPVKFHRILNKFFSVDYQSQTKGEDELENKEDESDESNDTGETYSCVYCNHVFKSHYCYQKHKRRHINPVTVDLQANEQEKKLLVMKDLNVQYFPCKICGAKFPSYYFVHKHKKLWHRAQLEQELEQQEQGPSGAGLLLTQAKEDFNAK